ncbi:unnamed protein product [Mytilus coruscus]|uniref:Uncharacterized protein n=1 Tax=Mytilus coruscus TaxID=42192 RepID=A0A6J8F0M0_MYTCO|nr:unnamed protein product [Mytilus coruscus]
MDEDIEFAITISDRHVDRYIDRLLKDWGNGFADNTFLNRSMSYPVFTEKFINNSNKLDWSKQIELACKQDIKNEHRALRGSCLMGSVDIVKWISKNSDINYCGKDGYFPLLLASQQGHVNVVKELLQQSQSTDATISIDNEVVCLWMKCHKRHAIHVNKCRNDDTTLLQNASVENRIEVVSVHLQCQDISINLCDKEVRSSLYWASQQGHVGVVKELLQQTAKINVCSNKDDSPLWIASKNGHVHVVTELLQHSADIKRCKNNGVSPLWITSYRGHVNVVKELLHNSTCSTEVNFCNNKDATPLWVASQEGHAGIVKELLQYLAKCVDVDVNLCDDNGGASLYLASQEGHFNVVKILIKHFAKENTCNDKGLSPLWIASQEGHVPVVEELLQHSADVIFCNNIGLSPLWIASRQGHVNTVKELLCHFEQVNKCCDDGISPLQIASYNNRIKVVKVLFQCQDIIMYLCDKEGRSALYWASQQGHVGVVKELLQQTTKINICRDKGASPLWIASKNGHEDVVTELSADSTNCKNNGVSPLDSMSPRTF